MDGEYRGFDFTVVVILGNSDVLVGLGKRVGSEVGYLVVLVVYVYSFFFGIFVFSFEKG